MGIEDFPFHPNEFVIWVYCVNYNDNLLIWALLENLVEIGLLV